jgi:exopolyphosphatase / guanosine-5'-triphosphate,3'-diphosphate pyrophosphatase
MVYGIAGDDIRPEKINRLVLTLSQLDACLTQMKTLTTAERVTRLGLDPGRADVLPAGTAAVIGIMRFLGASNVRVSMSDLLEGLLIEY